MGEEERKVIEYFEKELKVHWIESNFTISDRKNLRIVLNLIEKQQAEIEKKDTLINEQLKENVRLQKELNEENKRCMVLANNDKFKEQTIDLMSEQLAGLSVYDENDNLIILKDKEEVKQYFEKKVEG